MHPDSVQLSKCHQGIDKKYKGPWDAANAELDRARTDGAARAAQAKIDRIRSQDEADRERLCKPIENGLSKKWQATFDRIVDLYAEHPPATTLDRAAELAAHARAFGF